MRYELIRACKINFEGEIEKHRMNVENLLRNPQGVAEHGDIMDTIEKELDEMSKNDDLLDVIEKYFESEDPSIGKVWAKIPDCNEKDIKFEFLNGLNFINPDLKKFPVVKLLNKVPNKQSYFETILISINDNLVDKYLRGEINYNSLNYGLIKLIKNNLKIF